MANTFPVRRELHPSLELVLGDRWLPVNRPKRRTMQYFITARCNKRCGGCFFREHLGREEVSLAEYEEEVGRRAREDGIEKVNLLGGEPTLHPDLAKMISYNESLGLATRIYSNGAHLERIPEGGNDVLVRLSILSYDNPKEKPITAFSTAAARRPLTIIYPLHPGNIDDVGKVLDYCERLDVRQFVFSTIKRHETRDDFFMDKEGCLSTQEYVLFLNRFFEGYDGNLKEFHINARGVFDLGPTPECPFVNRLPGGLECNCPFDIDIGALSRDRASYGGPCSRGDACYLQKVVVRKEQT